MAIDLSKFTNSWYSPGRSRNFQALWYAVGLPILRSCWVPSYSVRRQVLRLFGAKIGCGVVIKPGVRVKYPWFLEIGDHSWIGEDVWIDNLALVQIGANVCLSQGAYLCTGNHDWSDPAFGLIVQPIVIHAGAWVGAKTIVGPGAVIGLQAIATAGSVVTGNLDPDTIYSGNPAVARKARVIRTEEARYFTPAAE
uniref:Transferase hexapeptide repeat containing protein n=1 Tax=Solibacter usitatus (strain Ellin6076) TaxID=234267 RepID=Q01XK0_SOLUE